MSSALEATLEQFVVSSEERRNEATRSMMIATYAQIARRVDDEIEALLGVSDFGLVDHIRILEERRRVLDEPEKSLSVESEALELVGNPEMLRLHRNLRSLQNR